MKKILLSILLFLYAALAWGQFFAYNTDISKYLESPSWEHKYAYSLFFTNPLYTDPARGTMKTYLDRIYYLSVTVKTLDGTQIGNTYEIPYDYLGISPYEMDTIFYIGEILIEDNTTKVIEITYSYDLRLIDPNPDTLYRASADNKKFRMEIDRDGDIQIIEGDATPMSNCGLVSYNLNQVEDYSWVAGIVRFFNPSWRSSTIPGIFDLSIIKRLPQPGFSEISLDKSHENNSSKIDEKSDTSFTSDICLGDKIIHTISRPDKHDASFVHIERAVTDNGQPTEDDWNFFRLLEKNDTSFTDDLSGVTVPENDSVMVCYRMKLVDDNWQTNSMFFDYPTCPASITNKPYRFIQVIGLPRTNLNLETINPVCIGGEGELSVKEDNGYQNDSLYNFQVSKPCPVDNNDCINNGDGYMPYETIHGIAYPDSFPKKFDSPLETNISYRANIWRDVNSGQDAQCVSPWEYFKLSDPPLAKITIQKDLESGYGGYPIISKNGTGNIFVTVEGQGYNGNNDSLYIYLEHPDSLYKKIGGIKNGVQDTVTGLKAGLYYLQAKNSDDCFSETDSIIMKSYNIDTVVNNGTASANKNDFYYISCHGAKDGIVDFIVDSANMFNLYLKNNIGEEQKKEANSDLTYFKFSNLDTGTYTLYICDTNDEVFSQKNIKITQPPPLQAFISYPIVNGYDIACGNGTFDNLSADAVDYIMGLMVYYDDQGISHYGKIQLYDDQNNPIDSITSLDYGNRNEIDECVHSFTNLGLTPGNYRVAIEDINGCMDDTAFTIDPPPDVLTITNYEVSDYNGYGLSCPGKSDGAITNIQAEGGHGDITLFIGDDTVSAAGKTSLGLGTYPLFARDENGCQTDTISIDMHWPEPMEISETLPGQGDYNIPCYGETGIVEIAIDKGVPPYTVSNADTAIQTNGVCFFPLSGNELHSLDITDDNGATRTTDIYLIAPENPVSIETLQITTPSCSFNNDGEITVHATGGVAGYPGEYVYELFDASMNKDSAYNISHTFTNISAGNYLLVITDDNGCIFDTSLTVDEPAPLTASGYSFNANCNGLETAMKAEITGGTPPYNISWKNSDGYMISDEETFITHEYGTYYLEVTDANNCQPLNQPHADTIEHTATTAFRLDVAKQDVTCFGCSDGRVTLQASGSYGPYQYSSDQQNWTSSQTYAGLSSSLYTFFAKDIGGCITSDTITINEPGEFNAVIQSTENVLCHGGLSGSITVKAVGGNAAYLYAIDTTNWQNNGSFDSLQANNYTIYIKDAYNYLTWITATLSEPDELIIDTSAIQHTLCGENTGAASVEVSGGVPNYTINWWHEDTLVKTGNAIDSLYFGKYVPVVTDDNYCKDSINVYINNTDGPKVTNKQSTPVSCWYSANGNASFSAVEGTPPYQIMWDSDPSKTDTFANYLAGGVHEILVTDNLGCGYYDTLFIPVPDTIKTFKTITSPTCYGGNDGSITVMAYGGTMPYTYKWTALPGSPGTTTINNIPAGKQTLLITDGHSCISYDTIIVPEAEKLYIDGGADQVICNGQTARLDAGSGWWKYQWTKNGKDLASTQIMDTKQTGTYIITAWDEDNCTAKDTVVISISGQLFNANFLLPAEADVNDTLVLIEYSDPSPDSVSWSIPEGFAVILDEYPLYWLKAQKPGTHSLGLVAYFNECISEIEKEVTIKGNRKKAVDPQKDTISTAPVTRIMKLYPNPAKDYVTIFIQKEKEERGLLTIYNMAGKPVFQEQLPPKKKIIRGIALDGYKPGMYLVEIRLTTGKIIKKLIIE